MGEAGRPPVDVTGTRLPAFCSFACSNLYPLPAPPALLSLLPVLVLALALPLELTQAVLACWRCVVALAPLVLVAV